MALIGCEYTHCGEQCGNDAVFLCPSSHIVCGVHSIDARSKLRVRNTDRVCAICGGFGMVKIFAKSHSVERREPADPAHRRQTAEA